MCSFLQVVRPYLRLVLHRHKAVSALVISMVTINLLHIVLKEGTTECFHYSWLSLFFTHSDGKRDTMFSLWTCYVPLPQNGFVIFFLLLLVYLKDLCQSSPVKDREGTPKDMCDQYAKLSLFNYCSFWCSEILS